MQTYLIIISQLYTLYFIYLYYLFITLLTIYHLFTFIISFKKLKLELLYFTII